MTQCNDDTPSIRRIVLKPVCEEPLLVMTAAEAACPNPHCVDGRIGVGGAGCAICGGLTIEELTWRIA